MPPSCDATVCDVTGLFHCIGQRSNISILNACIEMEEDELERTVKPVISIPFHAFDCFTSTLKMEVV